MRRLALHREVLKELPNLPAKQYRQVAGAILDLLAEPYPHYGKPLTNSVYWRISVGEYRVVYRADDDTVYVAALGKRNDGDIYRALDRKM